MTNKIKELFEFCFLLFVICYFWLVQVRFCSIIYEIVERSNQLLELHQVKD
jgi:hypothetical protein